MTTPTKHVQNLNGHQVQIFKSKKTGERVAVIDGNTACCIPLEILSLAAGKDAWMRGIEYKCNDCGERHPASAMECLLCPDCYEKMINGEEFNQ
jgi:hypothetical protein